MENQEIKERKLSIFQSLRKRMFLRTSASKKVHKYAKLPEYLKQDREIIDAIMPINEYNINIFPFEIRMGLVRENLDRINFLYKEEDIEKIIKENPQAFGRVAEYKVKEYLLNGKYWEYVKYLSLEFQKGLLSQDEMYTTYNNKTISGYTVKNHIAEFSEEAILAIAIEDKMNDARLTFGGRLGERIGELPIKTQIKLYMLSDKYEISKEALLTYVGDNPLLYSKLPNKYKDEIVAADHSKYLQMPDEYSYLPYGNNFSTVPLYKNSLRQLTKNIIETLEFDVGKIKLMFAEPSGGVAVQAYEQATELRDWRKIVELGKFNPEAMNFGDDYFNKFKNFRLAEDFVKYLEEIQYGALEGPVGKMFESVSQGKFLFTPEKLKTLNNLGKLVLDTNIVSNIPQEEILECAETGDHSKLIEIVRKTYGDKSAQILEDRPNIKIKDIPNFYIFDPKVVEAVGIGGIHSNLSFNMSSSVILSEFSRNPELIAKYKEFEQAFEGKFEKSAEGLEKKLKSFYLINASIPNVDYSKLTEKQKTNYMTFIYERTRNNPQDVVLMPKTLEELESYGDRRNALYDEAIQKLSDPDEIKEMICRRFLGIDYMHKEHFMKFGEESLRGMCNYYNLKKFVNNPITLAGKEFSEEELDVLEMLTIFDEIEDPRVLKSFAEEMAKAEKVMTPEYFKPIKEKVPAQYSKEFVKSLMTVDKAKEMEANGDTGISTRVDEATGITIVNLKGADFKAYITNPYLNNSGVRDGTFSNVRDALENWKTLENGISSFSGCMIDQNETKSTFNKGIKAFGFFNLPFEQILGMGITDIHLQHNTKTLSNYTTEVNALKYDYPENFMRQTNERLEFKDPYADANHPYNEVASLRTSKDISKIKEGTNGGKFLPDFIMTDRELTVSELEELHELGIENVFIIEMEKYVNRAHERMFQKKDEIESRPESDNIRKFKNVISRYENEVGEDGGR